MPFISRRAGLMLDADTETRLAEIGRSRTEARQRVERAQMLLKYAQGGTVSGIARDLRTNRPRVERCLNKALQLGAWAALSDLPGRGRPARLSEADRAWVVALACRKPKELGYSYELWTTRLLAGHVSLLHKPPDLCATGPRCPCLSEKGRGFRIEHALP